MAATRFERFLPLAGVLAGICFAISGYLPMGPSTPDDPARMPWLADHQAMGLTGAVAAALLSVLVLFFAAGVRAALRSGESGESSYSSVAYAGMIAFAVSASANAMLQLATLDAASGGRAESVVTLGYLGEFAWVPWAAASAVMFLAVGLGGLRAAALPPWLAIVTVVLGLLCLLGPTGIAVFLVSPVWFVVTGVVLHRRGRASHPVPVDNRGSKGAQLGASSR